MHKQLSKNLFFRRLMAAFQSINCLSEKAYWSQHLRKHSTMISRGKKKKKIIFQKLIPGRFWLLISRYSNTPALLYTRLVGATLTKLGTQFTSSAYCGYLLNCKLKVGRDKYNITQEALFLCPLIMLVTLYCMWAWLQQEMPLAHVSQPCRLNQAYNPQHPLLGQSL